MSSWGDSWATSWASSWGSIATTPVDLGTPITNSGATFDTGNRYCVDQKSGFRVRPGELVMEYNGVLTRPESFDVKHPQLRVRSEAELLTGPLRGEPVDVFLADNEVKAEDL